MDELKWFKSSYSGGAQNCVEAAHATGHTAVRDTKNREGGILDVPADSWAAFITHAAKRAR